MTRIYVLTATHQRILAFVSLLILLASILVLLAPQRAEAAVQTGKQFFNTLIGLDNDNADNEFIQPIDVDAKQHLDNTDVLLGNVGDDLLIGLLGDDVLNGFNGDDILIGGVEGFTAPNSDVIFGERGDDINIWAPGDGSDLFIGGSGYDTQIFAPIVLDGAGVPQLVDLGGRWGRQIPQVNISDLPQFTCTVEVVPADENLGVDFLTRFFANGNLAVTVRVKDVEQVLCASPNPDSVLVADLTGYDPTTFVERPLSDFADTLLGAIMQVD